jgi:ferredoxin
LQGRIDKNVSILNVREIVYMKKPVVDWDLCIGCGNCQELCPLVFEVQDDEKSHVVGPDKCNTCNCEEAVDTCPVQAITIIEE